MTTIDNLTLNPPPATEETLLTNDDTIVSLEQQETETDTGHEMDDEIIEERVEIGSEISLEDTLVNNRGLKVLFLSSDTGGGHRASAEALAGQFQILFPGSTYELLDVASEAYLPPYNSIVSYYKHLSAHPTQWKILYGVSNSKAMERVFETNIKVMTLMCERSMRRKLKTYQADVVVSVHPLMTSVPIQSCAKISHETGKHLPIFTVVTDLGSAHFTWFANGVEKMFVGSQQIYDLAKDRGKVPDEKIVLLGLPIRHEFSVQAEKLGDRMSPQGKEYQRKVRQELGLPALDRKTLLVMGGGEGVGSLSNIVDALYIELVKQRIDAVILVVCGRNEKLKKALEERNWPQVMERSRVQKTSLRSRYFNSFSDPLAGCGEVSDTAGCIESGVVTKSLRRILSSGSLSISRSENALFVPSPTRLELEEEKKTQEEGNTAFGGGEENKAQKPLQFRSASIGSFEVESDLLPRVDERAAGVHPAVTMSTDEIFNVQQPPNQAYGSVETVHSSGNVTVVGLGFVTRMAEYMVAADVLVSKAGPGTISEAAAVSLPVMLTSFLPGQEEGNVGYVVDGGFGSYCDDSDPGVMAEEVARWLTDEEKLTVLSKAAKAKGVPYAARDIVQQIGDSSLKWRAHNEAVHKSQGEVKTN
jgi:UDP-N-acetylglucosamine:LPS N-acetylglucosamine transferase